MMSLVTLTELFLWLQRWLADDFQKERQRHIANAKKLTKAVDTFHKTKDARKIKKSKVRCVFSFCLLYILHLQVQYSSQ